MKKAIAIATVALVVSAICAEEAGFQLSLTPDVAIHSRTTTIRGVSIGIWSENPQHSFTLGFVNGSTGESSGFSWAFIANYADSYKGVQWGLVNVTKTSFVGWQSAWVNYSRGTCNGLQTGLVNIAQDFKGLQWGTINYADNLKGVQIGVLNIAVNNPWFKEFPNKLATGFPIVNWSF